MIIQKSETYIIPPTEEGFKLADEMMEIWKAYMPQKIVYTSGIAIVIPFYQMSMEDEE